MPLLYALPPDQGEMFVLTFVDHRAQQFVDLGAFAFRTAEAAQAAWETVTPCDEDGSVFLIDRHDHHGLIDSCCVRAELIEHVAGRPIAELIRDGRMKLREWIAGAMTAGGRVGMQASTPTKAAS